MNTQELRMARLRLAVSRAGDRAIRDGIDSLAGRERLALHPVERSALGALRAARSPAQSVQQRHFDGVLGMIAEAVSAQCLEATRESLGDHADDPSPEQLDRTLTEILERFDASIVALMLAATALSDASAAILCDTILTDRSEFGLHQLDSIERPAQAEAPRRETAASSARDHNPSKPRRDRTADPHKPWKKDKRKANLDVSPGDNVALPADRRPARSPLSWREPAIPGRYQARFDPNDVWKGAVVLAEIPFVSNDPHRPQVGAKDRPCVVVAGNPNALLVRPGYTGRYQAESWRSIALVHWREAGLQRPTWVETDFRTVFRTLTTLLGWLSQEDWNALW